MTRDAFRRLALMVACSVWLAAIASAWLFIDWMVAAAAIFGGTIVAATLTVEPTAPKTEREDVRDRVVQGLGHRDIARKKRAAEPDDAA